MSTEFQRWAASYFSWVDSPDQNDIESCELAWVACKNKILKLLSDEKVDVEIIKKVQEDI